MTPERGGRILWRGVDEASDSQRGVVRAALLAVVIVVPMYAAFAAPFVVLGFAIREFVDRRWLTSVVLVACAGLAYIALQAGGRRFVSWAERRRQG